MGGALSLNSRSAERRDCEDSGRAEPRDDVHSIRAARIGCADRLRGRRIGAARIGGTEKTLGAQSRALSDLFTGPARSWNFAPAATVPIFNAGRLRNNVRLTEAFKEESVLSYQKAIQTSFREVADSLAAYQKTGEQRRQQELLVTALRETERLSTLRYRGGLDSYLQVLDADRNLFQGQLALAQLKREELLSVVQLYRSLGGGWQQ